MLDENKLIIFLNNNGFDVFNVTIQPNEKNVIQFKSFDNLLVFAKKHNIDTLFYQYIYISENDLIIDEDIIHDFARNFINNSCNTIDIINKKVEEYNKKVYELDYEKPISLEIYFIYQGFLYFTVEDDYWFIEKGFQSPKTAIIDIAEKNIEKISDEIAISNEIRNKKREELRETLFNDKNFQNCTNQQLRRAYMQKLVRNNKDIYDLFFYNGGSWYDISPLAFAEEVWREYKYKLKVEKGK